MTTISTLNDVKRDYRYVWEFEDGNRVMYKRCTDSCLALSRTMGVDFKAVYRNDIERQNNTWKDNDVGWCGETFYAVNPKGKIIVFYNSEWGGVGREK